MTKKIIGIGNAIVDILCKVQDGFLHEHSLIKNSMSLIDDDTANKLSLLKPEKITCGGSVSNAIATLGQLGCKTSFIGKVGSDNFGTKFISELEKTGTQFIGESAYGRTSAKSFVMITPDAHRTMCTFLGCASEINENDIDDKNFKDAHYLYLEGYLLDREETISGLKKAINLAKKDGLKIAFSLSDSFCVARHKKDFLNLVINDLDIVFANEHEALELISRPDFSVEILGKTFAKNPNLTAIVTRSEKGCMIFDSGNLFEVAAKPVEKMVDTTGAGDAFAAGFFYGLVNDFDLEKCGYFGNLLAAQIIQKFGARFEKEETLKLKLV